MLVIFLWCCKASLSKVQLSLLHYFCFLYISKFFVGKKHVTFTVIETISTVPLHFAEEKILTKFLFYSTNICPLHVHLHPSCCILANTVFFWMAFTKAFIHRIYIGKTLRQSLSVIFSKKSSVC